MLTLTNDARPSRSRSCCWFRYSHDDKEMSLHRTFVDDGDIRRRRMKEKELPSIIEYNVASITPSTLCPTLALPPPQPPWHQAPWHRHVFQMYKRKTESSLRSQCNLSIRERIINGSILFYSIPYRTPQWSQSARTDGRTMMMMLIDMRSMPFYFLSFRRTGRSERKYRSSLSVEHCTAALLSLMLAT